MNDMIVNPDKFQEMIKSCDKNVNNSIIISYVDSDKFLGIESDKQLNFEKHVSTIIWFYKFYQGNIVYYIYLYIANAFKYLFILSEIKESYLNYYRTKIVRFSLKKKHTSSFIW